MSQTVLCEGADLCQEIAKNGEDNSFTRTYQGNPSSRLIHETANLVLIADMSPLLVGHLLLLPKAHFLSFSAVLRNHADEVESMTAEVFPHYSATFGKPLVLEHGSAEDTDGSACVTHAHWHLVPIEGTAVDAVIKDDGLPGTELGHFAELAEEQWSHRPYYFTSYGGRHWVYEPLLTTRRQYLRSVVGRILSIADPEWDYALVIRREYLRETMTRARRWFHRTAAH